MQKDDKSYSGSKFDVIDIREADFFEVSFFSRKVFFLFRGIVSVPLQFHFS